MTVAYTHVSVDSNRSAHDALAREIRAAVKRKRQQVATQMTTDLGRPLSRADGGSKACIQRRARGYRSIRSRDENEHKGPGR